MKEFVLTQPYGSLEEMLNSAEVAVYKEELEQGTIKQYAIVSRLGNRYDLNGNKVDGLVDNPFCKEQKSVEVKDMKYTEIEILIEKEIEKAVAITKVAHAQELATIKAQHDKDVAELNAKHIEELAEVQAKAKADLIAKLSE